MRTEFTPAVLLRSVAFGDADRIVTLLTEAHGKVALIARSAKKSTRRFGGALEPCALIEAEIALGKGEVGRLAQARVVRAFPGILSELGRIDAATAGIELVRETIGEREPDSRLIPALVRLFEVVEHTIDPEPITIAFTFRVLALTGHAPNVTACGRCGRAVPEGKAALFDARVTSVVCRACGGGTIKLGGALRARIANAGTKRWDTELSPWPDQAREVVDEVLRLHVPRALHAGAKRR
jgi:DNA repair protein RecO (recombination protein O)